MKNVRIIMLLITYLLVSCNQKNEVKYNQELGGNKKMLIATVQKHLNAISNHDLTTLESTLHPNGKMQLILPGNEIINGVNSFVKYHKEWFKDSTWTFETKILNVEAGNKFGVAITEIVYREPDRNGNPYFNRMIVSYGLENINGDWYVFKDHASSIEKSTNHK